MSGVSALCFDFVGAGVSILKLGGRGGGGEAKMSVGGGGWGGRQPIARHDPNTSRELNTFRLCAWEGGPPVSNTSEGLTSWKLGTSCERAGRLVVVELVKSQKCGESKIFEWIKVGRCDLNYSRSSCVQGWVGGCVRSLRLGCSGSLWPDSAW
jgi:hypothetical protein